MVPLSDSPRPAWFQAFVERMSDLVVALDGEGTITCANPAVQLWLGADPDLIVGTNVLEWVYPDDMERALASMNNGAQMQETMAPTPFRLVRADGTHTTFDLLGHATLHDPVLGALTIVACEAGHHELVDRVLESMVADAPFEEILVQSATLMCRPRWQVQCAVRFQDVVGHERVVHTGWPGRLLHPASTTRCTRALRHSRSGHLTMLHPNSARGWRSSAFCACCRWPSCSVTRRCNSSGPPDTIG